MAFQHIRVSAKQARLLRPSEASSACLFRIAMSSMQYAPLNCIDPDQQLKLTFSRFSLLRNQRGLVPAQCPTSDGSATWETLSFKARHIVHIVESRSRKFIPKDLGKAERSHLRFFESQEQSATVQTFVKEIPRSPLLIASFSDLNYLQVKQKRVCLVYHMIRNTAFERFD